MFTKFLKPSYQFIFNTPSADGCYAISPEKNDKLKRNIILFAGIVMICTLLAPTLRVMLAPSSLGQPSNVLMALQDTTTALAKEKEAKELILKSQCYSPIWLIETPSLDVKKEKAEVKQNNAGTIKGYVKDETSKPVHNAVILLYKEDYLADKKTTDPNGRFSFLNVDPGFYILKVSMGGYKDYENPAIEVTPNNTINVDLNIETKLYVLQACRVSCNKEQSCKMSHSTTSTTMNQKSLTKSGKKRHGKVRSMSKAKSKSKDYATINKSKVETFKGNKIETSKGFSGKFKDIFRRKKQSVIYLKPNDNGEVYAPLMENEYMNPFNNPLSTFSIDVDNASYTNTRRMLQANQLPPKDAVRIEEFINYFDYTYPQPTDASPFSINLENASCPWNKDTRLVNIGIKGREVETSKMPLSNLVFLIDVSGSMQVENKLPLVKQSLKLLVDQLRPKDRIAIVTYAGAAGLALGSTECSANEKIKRTIDNLNAGGSTAGGQGIELAYRVAKENMKGDGNNRIILVTDGDFNVGVSGDGELKTLIEDKRNDGIYLTVCGFGMGNYKDSKMETLADYGNGNYFYIDNFKEAIKVFSNGLTGTLLTIAKDVKIQVEFNPKFVKAYRLIGYENRKLADHDFADDSKDAGELGAGHTVTALYEIIPAGSTMEVPGFIELKYQKAKTKEMDFGNELLTIKLRYKRPKEVFSNLLVQTLTSNSASWQEASDNFRYACGVVVYGMMLRDSKYKASSSYELAKSLLQSAKLNDENGYKVELLALIDKAGALSVPK